MSDAEDTWDLEQAQPVDVPVEDDLSGSVSEPDDGIPEFDEEDSEEVEATLGDDTYSETEADTGEGEPE